MAGIDPQDPSVARAGQDPAPLCVVAWVPPPGSLRSTRAIRHGWRSRPHESPHRLLKQFDQAQKMMKKMKGGGMNKMLRGLQGKLPMGGLPPFKP